MEPDQMARYGVSLPDWYHRKLVLWAKLKGTNRATLTSNIVQARIEANWDKIDEELREIAKRQGKPYEQLIEEWIPSEEEATEEEGD